MKNIKGKAIYSSYSEMLSPEHTAVLVVDMQNEGIDPHGYFGRIGADVGAVARIVVPLGRFLAASRKAGVRVVYVVQTTLRDGKGDSPAWLHLKERAYKLVPPAMGLADDYMVLGTEGQQVIEEIRPSPSDTIVEKSRASGFVNTPLDLILRSNGIRTVVVTGESSYGCVLNTVMDASCYDYYTVVVEDLIAGPNQDLHEAALKLMRPRHDVLKSAEILEVWGASGH